MPQAPTLEELYDQHASALFGFLLNLLRNESDARDVLQDVFTKIAQRPQLLSNVSEVRGFLLRLSHNSAIDVIRRQSTRNRNYDQLAQESVDLFVEGANPDEQVFQQKLAGAMVELPPDQRAVVHLKLWEHQTFDSIAETLGISPNTAASRYRYALDKLRERLRPIYEEIK
ncbi:MAG: polymerase sigma-70 factor, subfamily [Verrucomicrobiales bacterium]|nr:polymerase sigma-70 factor, subfamily [Verrucomicrobiales bacterium]